MHCSIIVICSLQTDRNLIHWIYVGSNFFTYYIKQSQLSFIKNHAVSNANHQTPKQMLIASLMEQSDDSDSNIWWRGLFCSSEFRCSCCSMLLIPSLSLTSNWIEERTPIAHYLQLQITELQFICSC